MAAEQDKPQEEHHPKVRRRRISWKRAATEAEKELAGVRDKLTATEDRHVRQAAEFQNYRRRVEEEKRELRESARARSFADLLPLFDMLDMALIAAEQGSKLEDLVAGLRMIEGQWQGLLQGAGVKEITGVGAAFNPKVHEAVRNDETEEVEPGTITAVLRKGFIQGERVLRFAQVAVAQAPEETPEEMPEEDSEGDLSQSESPEATDPDRADDDGPPENN